MVRLSGIASPGRISCNIISDYIGHATSEIALTTAFSIIPEDNNKYEIAACIKSNVDISRGDSKPIVIWEDNVRRKRISHCIKFILEKNRDPGGLIGYTTPPPLARHCESSR